jgi:acetyl-CoA C-acetyltransferase
MPRGIKDKVAILGMGCSKFGERWDSGAEELMLEAYKEAIADAGIDPNQLNAAWFSTAIDEVHVGKSGHPDVDHPAPAQHPGDACREHVRLGTEAFRGACYAVASGAADIADRARRREAEGHRLRRPARRARRSAAGAVERQRHGARATSPSSPLPT